MHDSIGKGCDGSILLNGEDVEQKAPVNKKLGGIKTVNDIKEAVEKVCPGVVSCTDVLVISTRAAIALVSLLISTYGDTMLRIFIWLITYYLSFPTLKDMHCYICMYV